MPTKRSKILDEKPKALIAKALEKAEEKQAEKYPKLSYPKATVTEYGKYIFA